MSTTVTVKMKPEDFDSIREALGYAIDQHRLERDQAAHDQKRIERLDHDILANEIDRILKNVLS